MLNPLRQSALGFAACALAVLAPLSAIAAPHDECPLARTPYSLDTPLIDILLDPAAKAAIQSVEPKFLADTPAMLSTTPPTFAAIINLRGAAQMNGLSSKAMDDIGAALAATPITPQATEARCARYDTVAPALPANLPRPAILVFEKINGFRDGPSVKAARAALQGMATRQGWSLVFTENGAVFDDKLLRRFDAVVWNNISGDALTVRQRKAFKAYLARGGGFAAMHGSAGDFAYSWDWYVDELIGARFIGHPTSPQFQPARVVVEDKLSGIAAGLPAHWTMTEEWYSFEKSPRLTGANVIATLDETTYSPKMVTGLTRDLAMGADHPIAWTRCLGKGRSFYTAIGHRPESYSEPNSVALLEQGIIWAAGKGTSTCKAGALVATERNPATR